MECLECGCFIDEEYGEDNWTADGDGPFCDECIDEVEAMRAEVEHARFAA